MHLFMHHGHGGHQHNDAGEKRSGHDDSQGAQS
jgi:hypothetical protein